MVFEPLEARNPPLRSSPLLLREKNVSPRNPTNCCSSLCDNLCTIEYYVPAILTCVPCRIQKYLFSSCWNSSPSSGRALTIRTNCVPMEFQRRCCCCLWYRLCTMEHYNPQGLRNSTPTPYYCYIYASLHVILATPRLRQLILQISTDQVRASPVYSLATTTEPQREALLGLWRMIRQLANNHNVDRGFGPRLAKFVTTWWSHDLPPNQQNAATDFIFQFLGLLNKLNRRLFSSAYWSTSCDMRSD